MSIVTEVCFVVESREYRVKSQKLIRTSEYYSDLLESSKEFSEIRLLLPDWITTRPFQVYLSYIDTSRLARVELIISQKLLWIADFFKDTSLQTMLITQQIIPFLSKETVLIFVQDSCTKIHTAEEAPQVWKDLYKASCSFAAKHIKYLFEKFSAALSKMYPSAMRQILEIAMKEEDSAYLLGGFCKFKKTANMLGLLPDLLSETLQEFPNEIKSLMVLDWHIKDFEFGNFYKESEVFMVGESEWVLCMWCFDHEKRLEISIKQYEISKEHNQMIAAISSVVQVQEEGLESITPRVYAIPVYSQKQNVIREIGDFDAEHITSFRIRLYARAEPIISEVLMQVSSTPLLLLEDSAKEVPKEMMVVLASSKHLNVRDEDILLEIVCKWCENNETSICEADAQSLADCIRWEFVTAKKIISTLSTYSCLHKFESFKTCFHKELECKVRKIQSKKLYRRALRTSKIV